MAGKNGYGSDFKTRCHALSRAKGAAWRSCSKYHCVYCKSNSYRCRRETVNKCIVEWLLFICFGLTLEQWLFQTAFIVTPGVILFCNQCATTLLKWKGSLKCSVVHLCLVLGVFSSSYSFTSVFPPRWLTAATVAHDARTIKSWNWRPWWRMNWSSLDSET